MHLAKRLALLVPMFALLACGGAVSKLGNGDAGDDGGPDPTCPSQQVVGSGGACFQAGQQCPTSETFPSCNGTGGSTTVECTCSNGSWQCPVSAGGAPSCPAPPVCPDPSAVIAGNSCYADPQLSCQTNTPILDCYGNTQGYLTCNCLSGTWACSEVGAPSCPEDAGGPCPDPNTAYAGQGCATYGTVCGGDPQYCGSGTVYDALQCVAGVWNVVASTSCDVDGGSVDAQGPDGGI